MTIGYLPADQQGNQTPTVNAGTDRSVIQLMLIETNTRYLVDTARIRSRGGFLTFYDAKPEDLLGPPLQDYARKLLGLGR